MKIFLALLLMLSVEMAFAQLPLPELSPAAMINQQVGYTQFEIHYGRPAARQRKIMGGVVPYKKLWRTGAGKTTRLSFSTEVMIDNNKKIPAGTYAFVTIPDEKEWTILLNRDTTKFYGDPSEYDAANEVARFTVKPEVTDRFYESLTIELDIKRYDAELYLAWENTQIHFPIATGSHQKAMSAIRKNFETNSNDVDALAQAAFYYTMNNEDPAQTLQLLDKALSIREDRWVYHQKIDLLEKRKNYTEARNAAKKAMAYLNKEKPGEDGGAESIKHIEQQMKTWPKE